MQKSKKGSSVSEQDHQTRRRVRLPLLRLHLLTGPRIKNNSMVNACPRFRNVLVNADYRAPLLAAVNRYFVDLLFRVHGGNCVTLVTAVNRYFVEFFLADGGNCVTLLTAVWGTLFGSDNCSTC